MILWVHRDHQDSRTPRTRPGSGRIGRRSPCRSYIPIGRRSRQIPCWYIAPPVAERHGTPRSRPRTLAEGRGNFDAHWSFCPACTCTMHVQVRIKQCNIYLASGVTWVRVMALTSCSFTRSLLLPPKWAGRVAWIDKHYMYVQLLNTVMRYDS